MTSSEFFHQKAELLKKQEPYLILSKEELVAEANNYYRIGDYLVEVTEAVQRRLDDLVGLTANQRKGITAAYGQEAVTNLRNSIAMANCVKAPQRFALVANSHDLRIDGIIPIKDHGIPMESFFNLLEMFVDNHSYDISVLETAHNCVYGITARLMPIHPEYDVFFGNDEFLTNGFYVKWNLGEMEVGNYYERQVCSNGAVETTNHSLARINSVTDKDVNVFLHSASKRMLINQNVNRMKQVATEASQTVASLAEVSLGKRLMTRSGIPENIAEQLMPYAELLSQYDARGFGSNVREAQAKSNISMWELYNRLTEFATHNRLWSNDDNRRSNLMQQSVALLQKKRDIQPYFDIFDNGNY